VIFYESIVRYHDEPAEYLFSLLYLYVVCIYANNSFNSERNISIREDTELSKNFQLFKSCRRSLQEWRGITSSPFIHPQIPNDTSFTSSIFPTVSFDDLSFAEIPFEERCIYTASETSVYLSIVRVYFVTSTGRTDADSLLPCRLTYRTFTPNQTVLGSTSTPPEFEDTRNLCDRVNQWLHITGM